MDWQDVEFESILVSFQLGPEANTCSGLVPYTSTLAFAARSTVQYRYRLILTLSQPFQGEYNLHTIV